MKKVIIICLCGFLIAGSFYFFRSRETIVTQREIPISYSTKEVKLGTQLFMLDIADTPALQERGLSYRKSLAPNTGMLFVFQSPAPYSFWMKDMNFPIDIIWLDKTKKVVHIEHALSPSTYPESFGPQTATQYVIEIPAGAAAQVGLTIGNVISF